MNAVSSMTSTPAPPIQSAEELRAALSTGPVQCTSWCAWGDGHPGLVYREDQYCLSVESVVVTTLGETHEQSDGTTYPSELKVYAQKSPDEAAMVVLVDDRDRGINLTASEARELARQMQHFAWVAEQGTRG